jgi:hypothetical protein
LIYSKETDSVTHRIYTYSTQTEGDYSLSTFQNTLKNAHIGDSTVFENLTIFPMFLDESAERSYLTLDEALSQNSARITEISESGSVPDLQFVNDGDKPVLLLDGEELVGAKQNRVLNLSILVPAKSTISIPVSCVEHGRWSYKSDQFFSEDRVHFSSGRSAKAASVSMSMSSGGSRHSNQGEVWDDIAEKSSRLGVSSPTDSMSDIYEEKRHSIDKFVNSTTAADQQIGGIFCIDGAVAGIDMFDVPHTFNQLFSKLVRSYALDALETTPNKKKATELSEAQSFINILCSTETKHYPALGLGEDLRLQGKMIAGGALINENRLIHLGAFPLISESPEDHHHSSSRMTRASRRRRIH